jgi:hypothetical protein
MDRNSTAELIKAIKYLKISMYLPFKEIRLLPEG